MLMSKEIKNLKVRSMRWRILILFQEAFVVCVCLRIMKQWSRWSWREEARQWDTFPEPTELLLIGCLSELTWTPKSKSSTSTPKKQLADILTKGNFTRDEWNHLLCLFNISHFSSAVCSDTVAKRSQRDSGEERVTAKSRLVMNLIARTPSFAPSSTSVSPVKKHYGSQDPSKSVAGEDRSGRPDKGTDLFEASDHYSPWAIHGELLFNKLFKIGWWPCLVFSRVENWGHDIRSIDHEEILLDGTAQSVRNEEALRDRSGRPDNINSQEVAKLQNFVMGNDETELELPVESRLFVNRVNDQLRKRQKKLPTLQEMEKNVLWFGNDYGCNNGISSIHGKELPKQLPLHCEYCRSHIQANVWPICEISGRTRWDLRFGND